MLIRQAHNLNELGTRTFFNIFLVANSFIWYYAVLIALRSAVSSNQLLFWTVHFSGLIVSAIAGASVSKRIDRMRFLTFWISLSTIASFTLPLLNISNTFATTMIGLFLGVSLGLGMPTCMGLFTDSIPVQNRGQVSGIIVLTTGVGIFAFSLLQINEGITLALVLATWRIASLVILRSVKWPLKAHGNNDKSYKLIFFQKSFILYFIPWLMFSLVNYLIAPLEGNYTGTDFFTIILVQIVFMAIFALIGGFLADSVGRKRIAIGGFALLGIGTAILGISKDLLARYLNAMLDGIAWGFLLVLFIVTLWGDLSYNSRSDKYYAIGVLPFFTSKLLELTVGDPLKAIVQYNSYAFFSFTTFFLFIGILPLVYAPETLPDKNIRERELKDYVKKAQKLVTEKTQMTIETTKNMKGEREGL